METEINIVEILKDKPANTKLYSPLFGEVFFSHVSGGYIAVEHHGGTSLFLSSGRFYDYDGAEPLLFPSKEMRDWSKFFKKGDVLVHRDCDIHVIFEGFKDNRYTRFKGKHYLWKECFEDYSKEVSEMVTFTFRKVSDDEAKTYINTLEKHFGGKLNRETLEIEKPHPEFKDGDIVCISGMGYLAYGIVKSIDYSSKKLEYYVLNDMSTLKFEDWLSFEDKQIQPITETQQIILFDTLAKRGKAWDAEKKAIVGLKPKFDELKPFDKVLVRDSESDKWRANLFGYIDKDEYYHCVYANWVYCIPYAGNEHLLGTTKDVEG